MATGDITTWRVRADHPRLLFNADSTTPDGRPLIEVLRERLRDPLYNPLPNRPVGKVRSEMLALRWCVLGDRAAARQAMNNLLETDPPTGNELRDAYVAEHLGITYDWLHAYLDAHPTEKRAIEKRMMEYVRRFRLAVPYLPVFHNYAHAAVAGYGALILALANGPHDDELQQDLALLQHFLEDDGMLLDVWAYQDGAWHEGIEYGLSECYAPLVQTLMAIKSATSPSIDYFAHARRRQNDWINRFARYLICKRRPDWTYIRDGDVLPDWVFIGWRTYTPMLITAQQYQDPVLFSYLRAVADRDPKAVRSNMRHFFLVAGKEPDTPAETWTSLPLSARFGKDAFEHIFFRSGWGPDDTLVAIRAGDYFTHHQHLDAGHFSIYHHGALAIDSGFYAGMYNDHWSNYEARTIAHNCVTVYDPKEKFERYTANDGGQRIPGVLQGHSTQTSPWLGSLGERRAHLFTEPHYRTGEVLRCASDDGVHYVAIDLTWAYNSTRFSTWQNRPKIADTTRELVYLPGREVVVVFDRVVATSADFKKTWLLHTVQKPTVPGGEEPAGKDGLIVGTGDVVRVDRTGTLRGAKYDGRMILRALLPVQPALDLRGGKGFEFFCDGANRAVEQRYARRCTPRSPREAGQWRIELSPREPALETRFLVVMQLGRRASLRKMPAVRRIGDDTSAVVGVALEGGPALLFVPDVANATHLDINAADVKSDSCLVFIANRTVADVRVIRPDGSVGEAVPFRDLPGHVRIDFRALGAPAVRVSLKPR